MKRVTVVICLALSLSLNSGCTRNPGVSATVSAGNEDKKDQAVAPASKSPADTASQDSEVRTGKIPINLQAVKASQEEVNQGHFPQMLDPYWAAYTSDLGFSTAKGDSFTLVQQVEMGPNGTGAAIVEATHGQKVYTIHLVQPLGPGQRSIWVVDEVEEKHP